MWGSILLRFSNRRKPWGVYRSLEGSVHLEAGQNLRECADFPLDSLLGAGGLRCRDTVGITPDERFDKSSLPS